MLVGPTIDSSTSTGSESEVKYSEVSSRNAKLSTRVKDSTIYDFGFLSSLTISRIFSSNRLHKMEGRAADHLVCTLLSGITFIANLVDKLTA